MLNLHRFNSWLKSSQTYRSFISHATLIRLPPSSAPGIVGRDEDDESSSKRVKSDDRCGCSGCLRKDPGYFGVMLIISRDRFSMSVSKAADTLATQLNKFEADIEAAKPPTEKGAVRLIR
jgi:hypothetical protein